MIFMVLDTCDSICAVVVNICANFQCICVSRGCEHYLKVLGEGEEDAWEFLVSFGIFSFVCFKFKYRVIDGLEQ